MVEIQIEANGFRRCTRCGARWDRHSTIDVEGHDCERDALPSAHIPAEEFRDRIARHEQPSKEVRALIANHGPILVGKPRVVWGAGSAEVYGEFQDVNGQTEWRRLDVDGAHAIVAAVGHLAEETEELRKMVLWLAVKLEEKGG